MNKEQISYKPIPFILIAYCITWGCAFFIAYQTKLDYTTLSGKAILVAIDFLKSASPLIAAMILLRKYLWKKRSLSGFFFGYHLKVSSCVVVALLFILQFFTFYLSRLQTGSSITISVFLSAWAGQILFGGGMEEGGWRGYLQLAFEKKVHTLPAVVGVSLVWVCWHLPYFFLPDTFQAGSNFLFYFLTTTATAFTLTAIHKMTGSVFLCMLFHGWQNAIVMNIAADMGSPLFLILFCLQTVVSIFLCIRPVGIQRQEVS